jgi:hypothetical protein
MPEIPIGKNDDPRATKHEVRATWQVIRGATVAQPALK